MTMYPKSELRLEGEGDKQELVVSFRCGTKWLDEKFSDELRGQIRSEALQLVNRWYSTKAREDVSKIFNESFNKAADMAREHMARWNEPEIKKYAEAEFKARIDGVVEEALDELKQRILRGTRASEDG